MYSNCFFKSASENCIKWWPSSMPTYTSHWATIRLTERSSSWWLFYSWQLKCTKGGQLDNLSCLQYQWSRLGDDLYIWAPEVYEHKGPGGRFKNTYELLNLRARKISTLYKNRIFQCMGKIICVEFQRYPLKFHTKYLTHTLKDVDFIHSWKFKSS